MFSAIIHKKGIHNAFNEDALTSLVFDTLKILPPQILKEFIMTAKNLDGNPLDWPYKISAEETPKFAFWPAYKKQEFPKIGKNTVPDLKIEWHDYLILEESKWESPKSSEEDEKSAQPKPEAQKKEAEDKEEIYDQLSRQLLISRSIAQGKKDFAVLYVTDDFAMPEEDLQATIDALEKKNSEIPTVEFRNRLFWTNWHNLTDVLLKNSGTMADDLYQSLEVLGIRLPFTGFGFLQELKEDEKPNRELLNQDFVFYQYQDTSFKGFDFLENSKKFPVPDVSLAKMSFIFYQGGEK